MTAPEGLNPGFLQLYFIDTDHADECRRQIMGEDNLDEDILPEAHHTAALRSTRTLGSSRLPLNLSARRLLMRLWLATL